MFSNFHKMSSTFQKVVVTLTDVQNVPTQNVPTQKILSKTFVSSLRKIILKCHQNFTKCPHFEKNSNYINFPDVSVLSTNGSQKCSHCPKTLQKYPKTVKKDSRKFSTF